MNDEEIKKQAEQFARDNRQNVAKRLTDKSKYLPDIFPASIFMAGSPGAGKTEFSKRFIESFEKTKDRKIVRIDADDLRDQIPGYTGKNSYLFQTAVSLIVERIHDIVLDNKQTFLLDGTLSNYEKAVSNINRSLSKNREVIIFYLYQKPEVAWKFTKAREKEEGRNIPKEIFVEQFIKARENVEKLSEEFKNKISIYVVKKNFEINEVEGGIEIKPNNKIDIRSEKIYTKDELSKLLYD